MAESEQPLFRNLTPQQRALLYAEQAGAETAAVDERYPTTGGSDADDERHPGVTEDYYGDLLAKLALEQADARRLAAEDHQ